MSAVIKNSNLSGKCIETGSDYLGVGEMAIGD